MSGGGWLAWHSERRWVHSTSLQEEYMYLSHMPAAVQKNRIGTSSVMLLHTILWGLCSLVLITPSDSKETTDAPTKLLDHNGGTGFHRELQFAGALDTTCDDGKFRQAIEFLDYQCCGPDECQDRRVPTTCRSAECATALADLMFGDCALSFQRTMDTAFGSAPDGTSEATDTLWASCCMLPAVDAQAAVDARCEAQLSPRPPPPAHPPGGGHRRELTKTEERQDRRRKRREQRRLQREQRPSSATQEILEAGVECEDCAGVPHGVARIDVCGVCGGNARDVSTCDRGICADDPDWVFHSGFSVNDYPCAHYRERRWDCMLVKNADGVSAAEACPVSCGTGCADQDDCMPVNPCLNGGTCTDPHDDIGAPVCDCPESYVDCGDDQCLNGDANFGAPICDCPEPYGGPLCGDTCFDDPNWFFHHNGIDYPCHFYSFPSTQQWCTTATANAAGVSAPDACPVSCGTGCADVDDCQPTNPCLNGGTCTDPPDDNIATPVCDCPEPYGGPLCGSTCFDDPNWFVHNFQNGIDNPCRTYSFPRSQHYCTRVWNFHSVSAAEACPVSCGTGCADVDDCQSTNPCLNGGVCTDPPDDNVGAPVCDCPEPYVGEVCESRIPDGHDPSRCMEPPNRSHDTPDIVQDIGGVMMTHDNDCCAVVNQGGCEPGYTYVQGPDFCGRPNIPYNTKSTWCVPDGVG
eukprot:COSAG02_NODE_265_length_26599_cov_13.943698_5_plen_691_part_00